MAKKRRKTKDKWGQPLPSADAVAELIVSEGGGYEEEYESRKVVVSGLPYCTTEEDIREFVQEIGDITQMQMTRFPDTGNFRGLVFLTFKTLEGATKCLDLDGAKMGDRFVKVERCRMDVGRKRKSEFHEEPRKIQGSFSAYLGNVAWDATEQDIKDFLSRSKIASIRFAMNQITGKFRGFAHVDFEDDESLEEAVKMNQMEFHGRPMKIAYAVDNVRVK